MPVDWSRYPPKKEWVSIRAQIRDRAGNKCEWCGLPNHAVGHREKDGTFSPTAGNLTHDAAGAGELSFKEAKELIDHNNRFNGGLGLNGEKGIIIVCTTAHLGTPHPDGSAGDKHDKRDVRPENLAFLCQRCHLLHDIEEHKANAAQTRGRQRREASQRAGQLELIEL